MKIFSYLLLFSVLILTTSCITDLKYKYMRLQPKVKDEGKNTVAVVLNDRFLTSDYLFWRNDVYGVVDFKLIRKKIKLELENKTDTPVVYFYDLKQKDIEALKEKYDKVFLFDIKTSKELNFTGILDLESLVYPVPAPQWGNYTFNIDIYCYEKRKKEPLHFNYYIVSDFSYLVLPLIRIDAQKTSVERAIDKFTSELTSNKIFMDLLNNSDSEEIPYGGYYNYLLEEEGLRVIQREPYPDNDFPLSAEIRMQNGYTRINGYYNNKGDEILGATGFGSLKEIKLQFSTYNPVSEFYFDPTVGYYYQDVNIKDFGYDPTYFNDDVKGYNPGRVEERDKDGNLIKDANPYSMSYGSEFSSAYLGLKTGLNLVFGDNMRFLFAPVFYMGLFEIRHTTVKAGKSEFSSWNYPFFSMYGFSLETGIFFVSLHTGLKFGFDYAHFNKFSIKDKIKFNTIIRQDGIIRGKLIEINKFDASSYKAFFDIFFIF